jgi:uracil-DNA glycosylase
VFKVFRCSIDNIKIVLIGQDPYHQVGEAMGLSFSVPKNVKIPPSLVNIFKELNNEFSNKYNFTHGDLTKWFNNGVFLLNSALTVIDSKPNSHQFLDYKRWRVDILSKLNSKFLRAEEILDDDLNEFEDKDIYSKQQLEINQVQIYLHNL